MIRSAFPHRIPKKTPRTSFNLVLLAYDELIPQFCVTQPSFILILALLINFLQVLSEVPQQGQGVDQY